MNSTAAIARSVPEEEGFCAYVPNNMKTSAISAVVNGFRLQAIVDTASTDSFINEKLAKELRMKIIPER